MLGTSAVTNSSGTVDPRWECFVDGNSIGSEPPFVTHQNNWPLCVAPTLPDGEHVVTLNVTSSGRSFYFDQIKYLPTHNAESQPSDVIVIVEQTDPSISYTGEWRNVNDSAMSTSQVGATVGVNFTGPLSISSFIRKDPNPCRISRH